MCGSPSSVSSETTTVSPPSRGHRPVGPATQRVPHPLEPVHLCADGPLGERRGKVTYWEINLDGWKFKINVTNLEKSILFSQVGAQERVVFFWVNNGGYAGS